MKTPSVPHDSFLRTWLDLRPYRRRLHPVAVLGSPTTCIEGVREVIEAGAELVLFTPLHEEAAQMERLAAESVPAF